MQRQCEREVRSFECVEDTPPKSALSRSLSLRPWCLQCAIAVLSLSRPLSLSLFIRTLFGRSRGFDLYFRVWLWFGPLFRSPPLRTPGRALPSAPGQLLRAVFIIIRLLCPLLRAGCLLLGVKGVLLSHYSALARHCCACACASLTPDRPSQINK